MNARTIFVALAVLLVTCPAAMGQKWESFVISDAIEPVAAAGADNPAIHIPAGRNIGWNWTVKDGAGFSWDISSYGQVGNGTSDAYDGGMQLRVNNKNYSWGSAGRGAKDGREVETGPWNAGSIRIWRRVYVDKKLGYCRWIDIFQNTSSDEISVPLRYYTNVGGTVSYLHSSSGKAEVAKRDWGFVTASSASGGSSRPALVHIFSAPDARLRPLAQVTKGNDNIYYHVTLKIPAGKTTALMFFEAQRRPVAEARKFLKDFDVDIELQKVPSPLRKLLANFTAAGMSLGSIDLPRNAKKDLVVLAGPEQEELLGTLLDERFTVETFFGPVDLPAAEVVGFVVPERGDPYVHLLRTDGQVLAGRLRSGAVRIKPDKGPERSFSIRQLAAATFRVSPPRPAKIQLTRAAAVMRSGDRLAFDPAGLELTLLTEHGRIDLRAADLQALLFETPKGGLHQARFTNGSTLSGLLDAEKLTLKLAMGKTLSVRRQRIERIILPNAKAPATKLTELALRNETVLYGTLAGTSLTVVTASGSKTLKLADVSRIEVVAGTLAQVEVTLRDDKKLTGKLAERALRFQIAPGPALTVPVTRIAQITMPAPEGARSDNTATTRPAGTATGPATPDGKKIAGEIKVFQAKLAAIEKVRAKLDGAGQKKAAKLAAAMEVEAIRAQMAELQAELKAIEADLNELAAPRPRPVPVLPDLPKTRPAERR